MRKRFVNIHWVFLALITFCFGSCKSDEQNQDVYDPSKPVEIIDFSPKNGSARTRVFIQGNNFGNDVSQISVKIGGMKSKVIGCGDGVIYCVVPPRAYDGEVELTVGQGEQAVVVKAEGKFSYERKTMVSTLCGYVSETGEHSIKDGPFKDCGFGEPVWLSFDPKDATHLYLIERADRIRMLNMEKEEVSTVITKGQANWNRPRSLSWSPITADTMVVANDQEGDNAISNSMLLRKDAFQKAQVVTKSQQCNGSAFHPKNGELYYNYYGQGKVYRYDWKKQESEYIFDINDRDWEFNIQFHPSGKFAYIVVINKHYILKAAYDNEKKTLEKPIHAFGGVGERAWVDGIGTASRFNTPHQGVFVENEQYIKEGKEDIYDFYLCDAENHCIRIITPEGKVTTFAGRGSAGVNGDTWGYIDGDLRKEARFDRPYGIAYDKENATFYIADRMNHRIRAIVIE